LSLRVTLIACQDETPSNSSQLLFEVFRDNEPENLLFRQVYTETFEQAEEYRLRDALVHSKPRNHLKPVKTHTFSFNH
jgi:hypothetical protein